MNSFFSSVFIGALVVTATSATSLKNQNPEVSFATADQGIVHALIEGDGSHGVVLAHGAIFNKESWSDFSKLLVAKGLLTLALDFRGYGNSKPGINPAALHEDILAAVRYLHRRGLKQVSVIGASMGGGAAAQAAIESKPGEIDQVILLSAVPVQHPERLKGELLFIAGTTEPLVSAIKNQYQRAPAPKRLELIESNAHAQHMFKTDQGKILNQILVDFLVQ